VAVARPCAKYKGGETQQPRFTRFGTLPGVTLRIASAIKRHLTLDADVAPNLWKHNALRLNPATFSLSSPATEDFAALDSYWSSNFEFISPMIKKVTDFCDSVQSWKI
jgi:hypothetical protein